MVDTGFSVPDADIDCFPPQYQVVPGGIALHETAAVSGWRMGRVDTFCGGGGLVGTIDDYWRFCVMLRAGGTLDGARILAPQSLRQAAANQLPGDLAQMATEVWSETQFDGVGFGLLGSVVLDPAKAAIAAEPGGYGWGRCGGHLLLGQPGGRSGGHPVHPVSAVERASGTQGTARWSMPP